MNPHANIRFSGIQGIGISPEAFIETGDNKKNSMGLKASYLISSYSLLSYHASLNAGYLIGRNASYANGKVGIGFIIAFFDIGYQYVFEQNNSGLQIGLSVDQIISDYQMIGQLYTNYTFSLNKQTNSAQIGIKFLYSLTSF